MSLNQDASSASLVPGAAYVARSTWKPLSALVTGVVILLIAMAAATVTIIVMDLMGLRPDRGSGALWALAAWQIVAILLTLAFAAWGGKVGEVLALGSPANLKAYASALLIVVAFEIAISSLEFVFLPEAMFRDLRSFVEIARGPSWILGLLIVGIGAPLSEELLFRGFLLSALARSRLGFLGASLITTALWTALHAGYSIVGLVEIFAVGLLFSWLLWRTGSVRVTIVCHAVYNTLIMLALRYLPLPAGLLPA